MTSAQVLAAILEYWGGALLNNGAPLSPDAQLFDNDTSIRDAVLLAVRKSAEPDPLEKAAEELTNAMQAVAEAARDVSNEAEYRQVAKHERAYLVPGETMGTLQEALKGWTEASKAALQAIAAPAPRAGTIRKDCRACHYGAQTARLHTCDIGDAAAGEQHAYVSGVSILSGETKPRCAKCGEPSTATAHVGGVS